MTIKITKTDCKPELDPYHADTKGLTWTALNIFPTYNECSITQECNTNSTPIEVWNGTIIERKIHACLDDGLARNFLESDEGQGLLKNIISGYSESWNNQSNLIGGLDESSSNSLDELVENLERFCYSENGYWFCEEWFQDTLDEEIKKVSNEDFKSLADEYNEYFLIDDLETWIKFRRDEVFE